MSLRTDEVDSLIPADDEVVVEMAASACNPSDIAFIRGIYNIIKPVPAIPGFEAAGIVIAAGKNTGHLLGKKISCFVQSDSSGTWAEQFIVGINDLVVLDENMDMDQGAAFTVNPFTAFGLIEIAKLRESSAIIQNAAGGQVADFIRNLAADNGIEVLNIVRKESTAVSLKEAGVKHILCEQDEHFEEELQTIAHALNATTTFDAVGGGLSGQLFHAMPEDSELVVYGGLSGRRIEGINEMDLIFKNKIISGFNLIDWKNEMEEDEYLSISEYLQQQFISGSLQTKFQATSTLDDIVKGLSSYLKNMSAGKLLIKP